MKSPLHVQAHRGASSEAMENTLEAFRLAIRMGADSLEMDLHLSKDDVPIVYHDFEFSPADCSGLKKTVLVREMTASDISQLDCTKTKRLTEKKVLPKNLRQIPLLTEVLKMAAAEKGSFVLDLELKRDPQFPNQSAPIEIFVEKTLSAVSQFWDLNRTWIRSFDWTLLKEVEKQNGEIQRIALVDSGISDFQTAIDKTNTNFIAPDFNSLNPQNLSWLKRQKVRVIPYTANKKADWENLMDLGVDGITTDNPRGLLKLLGRAP